MAEIAPTQRGTHTVASCPALAAAYMGDYNMLLPDVSQ